MSEKECIRIANITISKSSSPELFKELYGLSQKARGERLRCLATIGTLCVSSPSASLNLSINNDDKKINTSSNKQSEITKKIMNSL